MEPIKIQNRSNAELQTLMRQWGACDESQRWLGDSRDMKQALAECPKIGWVVFMARILSAEYGDKQPEYRKAYQRIFRVWKRMQRLVNHLDVEQATETKPISDKYYAAKRALQDGRDERWHARLKSLDASHAGPAERELSRKAQETDFDLTSQQIETLWMDTLAELKPFDAKYQRRRKAYHREALKAVRRRVEIEP